MIDENKSENFVKGFIACSFVIVFMALIIGASIYGWMHNDFSGLYDVGLYATSCMSGFCIYYFKSG